MTLNNGLKLKKKFFKPLTNCEKCMQAYNPHLLQCMVGFVVSVLL